MFIPFFKYRRRKLFSSLTSWSLLVVVLLIYFSAIKWDFVGGGWANGKHLRWEAVSLRIRTEESQKNLLPHAPKSRTGNEGISSSAVAPKE